MSQRRNRGRHRPADDPESDVGLGGRRLEAAGQPMKDASLRALRFAKRPGPRRRKPSNGDRQHLTRGGLSYVNRRTWTDRPNGVLREDRDLPVGDDLPDELSTAADDVQLDRRPADAPGIEATTLPRVERPDELNGQLGIRIKTGRRRDHEADGLCLGSPVVGALPRPADQGRPDLCSAVGGEDGRDRLHDDREVGQRDRDQRLRHRAHPGTTKIGKRTRTEPRPDRALTGRVGGRASEG